MRAKHHGHSPRASASAPATLLACIVSLTPMGLRAQSDLPVLNQTQGLGPSEAEVFPTPGGLPATLEYGLAIAADRSDVLVSMPDYRVTVGGVDTFRRSPSGLWEFVATLQAADAKAGDGFGERVAVNRDFALISAVSGVYVFRRNHTTWTEVQKLPGVGGDLALDDRFAFIGTMIFRIDPRGMLVPTQTLTSDSGMSGDRFGAHVAAAHETLIVSAPGDDDNKGAVYVFGKHGDSWVREQKLIAIDGRSSDFFGEAIAIGGDLIAVGAPGANANLQNPACFDNQTSGAIYVFARIRDMWVQQQEVPTPSCLGFGGSVAISRDWLAGSLATNVSIQIGETVVYRRTNHQRVNPHRMPRDPTDERPSPRKANALAAHRALARLRRSVPLALAIHIRRYVHPRIPTSVPSVQDAPSNAPHSLRPETDDGGQKTVHPLL